MHFAKVTAFTLFGAALSAPVTRVVKRDTASSITDAFNGLRDTLAPQLQTLTDSFNAADKSSDVDTFDAIRETVYDIGDVIDALQSDFNDLDTQENVDLTPITDAATAWLTDLLNAFRPITVHIDESDGFDVVTYGMMNGLGLQIGGTINLADIRLDGDLREALSANLASFEDVLDQIPGVGIAIDSDSSDKKKRTLATRASVDDIAAAFTTLQADVEGLLTDLASAWEGADKSSDVKAWQAISKIVFNIDTKVTFAADAIVKTDEQEGADVQVVVDASAAAYVPIVEAFRPISAHIEAEAGFKALAYGSMSSLSTKMLTALTTSDDRLGGTAVVDGAKAALADLKDVLQGLPALAETLF